jgi:hypothetical protein
MTTKLISKLGFLVLILLPIQNLLVQVFINNLGLPLGVALWKELLIVIIAGLMIYEISKSPFKFSTHWPILAFISLCLLSLISFWLNQVDLRIMALSFRAELFWLGFLAVGISYLKCFKDDLNLDLKLLYKAVYIGFAIITVLFLSVLAFGQTNVLNVFGFVDSWSSFEQVLIYSPICHSVDGGLGGCRLSLGFASPNHLAGYLVLVLAIFLSQLVSTKSKFIKYLSILFSGVAVVGIYMTYSRFAWLGLLISTLIAGLYYLHKTYFEVYKPGFKVILFILLLSPFVGLFGLVSLDPTIFDNPNLPLQVIKPASSLEHYAKTKSSMEIIANNPTRLFLGYGPGQSGTIAKPQYGPVLDTPIVKENSQIALNNGIPPYDLPVPESWYLQVLLNGGLLYLMIYLAICLYSMKLLTKVLTQDGLRWQVLCLGLGVYSILVGNLFLHIWENQTVAIYFVFVSLVLIYYSDKSLALKPKITV